MIPAPVKWAFSIFMVLFIPMNLLTYGPGNFLWFSDITLFLAFLAVLTESRLVASMAAVGGIIFESLWAAAFFLAIISDFRFELTEYMFDSSIPLWIRIISLFHLILPPLLFWLLFRLGYDRRAWPLQIVVVWMVALLTWFWTEPSQNINYIFTYQKINWNPIPFLLLEAGVLAILLTLTHLLITKIKLIKTK